MPFVNLATPPRVYRWLDRASAVMFAPHCALCGAPGQSGLDLCADCEAALPGNPIACPLCALPLRQPAPRCGECLQHTPPFAAAIAPFRYADPIDRLLTRFKFGGDLAAGQVLAALLTARCDGFARSVDQLLPMPLHRSRLRERGFNQAFELARALAIHSGVAARADLLLRVRPTAPQTGLDARARRRNVRGAFVVPPSRRPAITGRRLLLIDDVITTGASVREASVALLRAGAAAVHILAVARAG